MHHTIGALHRGTLMEVCDFGQIFNIRMHADVCVGNLTVSVGVSPKLMMISLQPTPFSIQKCFVTLFSLLQHVIVIIVFVSLVFDHLHNVPVQCLLAREGCLSHNTPHIII